MSAHRLCHPEDFARAARGPGVGSLEVGARDHLCSLVPARCGSQAARRLRTVRLYGLIRGVRAHGIAGADAERDGRDREESSRSKGFGRIAQLVEQLTLNQRVQGSSPCAPTIFSASSNGRGNGGEQACSC
jgi:hypothetical protein